MPAHRFSPLPQDYSYMPTPELPLESNSTLIPRRALPNPRIPAYVGGALAWGAPPARATGSGRVGLMATLPNGVVCKEAADGRMNCL